MPASGHQRSRSQNWLHLSQLSGARCNFQHHPAGGNDAWLTDYIGDMENLTIAQQALAYVMHTYPAFVVCDGFIQKLTFLMRPVMVLARIIVIRPMTDYLHDFSGRTSL